MTIKRKYCIVTFYKKIINQNTGGLNMTQDEKQDRNYWMFRVTTRYGLERPNKCLKEGFVHCGWQQITLIGKTPEEVVQEHPWAKKMAVKFTYIKENDIVIMPRTKTIAIGRVKCQKLRTDLDWPSTLEVEWLKKNYPRNNLPSNLQSSLKFRGTFLDLHKYAEEFENIIKSESDNITDRYFQKQEELQNEKKKDLAQHLSSRNLRFQDREFEVFIKDLFELNYPGASGEMNSQKNEAKDGKDLTINLDLEGLNISLQLNIQVKQHSGNENLYAVDQISKSDDSDPYVKNVVVTTANLDSKAVEDAEEKGVILFGATQLADMIIENFENIDDEYKAKLNLISAVHSI